MPKTRRFLHPAPEHPELDALVAQSVARVDAMTPEERETMTAEQNRNLSKSDTIWD